MIACGKRVRQVGPQLALHVFLVFVPLAASGGYRDVQDIKAFGLLDVSGHFRASYLFDESDRDAATAGNFESRVTWEEEFFLFTESYVYHPGFLNMEFGGGPLFVQQQFDSGLESVDANDTLFNFLANLSFLELKDYPFSLYYSRTHPSVTMSLAGRFLTQQDFYGAKGRINNLLGGSTSVEVESSYRDIQGSDLGWVVDNETDQKSVLITTSYRDSDKLELRYNRLITRSASGSPDLSIQPSLTDQELSEVRSHNRFGGSRQISVSQSLTRLQQTTEVIDVTTLDDWRYRGNLRWQHSDRRRSFLRLQHADSQRELTQSRSWDAELGFVDNISDRLSLSAGVESAAVSQTGFSRDEIAANGTFSYSRKTDFGSLGLSGRLRGARTDQDSIAPDVEVRDEVLVLAGTAPVELLNDFVVAGSIVLSNAGRTQVYVEGLDYRLVIAGRTTSVQRLLNGNITDGETVIADYRYETSGTAEYDTFESGISVNIGFLKTISAYARLNAQNTSIRSGSLENPVNDRESFEYGIGTTNQFLDGWSLSAHYRYLNNDEEISAHVSNSLDLGLSTSIRGFLGLTIGVGLTEIDYENTSEDIDQVSGRFGLSGRPFRGGQFSYNATYLSDIGGTLSRSYLKHRLNLQWRYRLLRITLRAHYSDESLGDSDRTDQYVGIEAMRVF